MKKILEYKEFIVSKRLDQSGHMVHERVQIDEDLWDLFQDLFDEFNISPMEWRDDFRKSEVIQYMVWKGPSICISFNGGILDKKDYVLKHIKSQLIPRAKSMGYKMEIPGKKSPFWTENTIWIIINQK